MAFNSFAIDRLAEVIPLSLSRFPIHGDVPSWNISIFYKTRALAETAVDIKLPLFCGFWLACGCVSSFSGWVVVRLEEGMWGQFTGFGFSMVDLAANSAWLVFRQGQEVLNCFKKWHAVLAFAVDLSSQPLWRIKLGIYFFRWIFESSSTM